MQGSDCFNELLSHSLTGTFDPDVTRDVLLGLLRAVGILKVMRSAAE